jgi:heavy metal translocating P-type ATPase
MWPVADDRAVIALSPRLRVARVAETALLPFTAACLVAGAILHLFGQPATGDAVWILATIVSAVRLAVGIAIRLLAGSTGVDVVALLAMVGSVALGEFLAGVVIAVMYATGQALERYAHGRAERELRALLSRAPGVGHRYEAEGLTDRPAEALGAGDRLLIKPGEVVPVDGVVVSGPAALDESALTGESRIVVRDLDDQVASGVVNAGAAFDLRATATADASTYAGIVRLVRIAQTEKSPFVRIADRYAGIFLVVSLGLAGVAWLASGDPVRGLAVLVVATPCPLLLAAPIAIVAGISRSARRGIIVKGGGALEALGRARVLLMDKTGTLTTGRPRLERVEVAPSEDADAILALAASLDQVSPHVLGLAIVHAARERALPLVLPSDVVEQAGLGIQGRVGGRVVALGSREWVGQGGPFPTWARVAIDRVELEGSMAILVEADDELVGILVMEDPIRPETPRALRLFRRAGIQRIVMVTGDHPAVAETVGAAIGVDGILAERTPTEKVEAVKAERMNAPGGTVMIGDGINDAPALAAADVGVAMGARGATASSEAADIVITVDHLDRLAEAITIARRSREIAVQSVVVGVGLSAIAMVAAAFGLLAPVEGALLQEGIDVIVILNALRALSGGAARSVQLAGWNEMRANLEIEHRQLLPLVASVGHMADTCDDLAPGDVEIALASLADELDDRLLRHEQLEETTIYPALAAAIGGQDPMAVMSGSHREIFHLVRLLRRNTTRLDEAGPLPDQVRDIRRILYGLHAILALHFAQEEELYAAVVDPRPVEPTLA